MHRKIAALCKSKIDMNIKSRSSNAAHKLKRWKNTNGNAQRKYVITVGMEIMTSQRLRAVLFLGCDAFYMNAIFTEQNSKEYQWPQLWVNCADASQLHWHCWESAWTLNNEHGQNFFSSTYHCFHRFLFYAYFILFRGAKKKVKKKTKIPMHIPFITTRQQAVLRILCNVHQIAPGALGWDWCVFCCYVHCA